MALADKKLNAEVAVDEMVAAAIRSRLEGGLLPCRAACAAAEALRLPPIVVGRTADALQIHLSACQLGLFGYPGHAKGWDAAGVAAEPVPAGLADALQAARDEHGEIGCPSVWREAERFGISRIKAGWMADQLGIPIRHCQLGAF